MCVAEVSFQNLAEQGNADIAGLFEPAIGLRLCDQLPVAQNRSVEGRLLLVGLLCGKRCRDQKCCSSE